VLQNWNRLEKDLKACTDPIATQDASNYIEIGFRHAWMLTNPTDSGDTSEVWETHILHNDECLAQSQLLVSSDSKSMQYSCNRDMDTQRRLFEELKLNKLADIVC
jgi:hypothetical protein